MPIALEVKKNWLLAGLPDEVTARLVPHLEQIELTKGQSIYQPGVRPVWAYFPLTAILSWHISMRDGTMSEIGMIGREGMVGTAVVVQGVCIPSTMDVLHAGNALRLDMQACAAELARGEAFAKRLAQYMVSDMRLTSMNLACYRQHSVEQQFCRWILAYTDRTNANELPHTHDAISQLLGVRREGITESVNKLQRAGLIESARGKITVLDRSRLAGSACECYAVSQRELAHYAAQSV